MIKFKPLFKECPSYPPGATDTYLPHPHYMHKESLPMAIFNDHRFAFFYWALWKKDKQVLPNLVTLDWHQDLVYPAETIKKIETTRFERFIRSVILYLGKIESLER